MAPFDDAAFMVCLPQIWHTIYAHSMSGVHPDARGFGIGFPEGHPGTPNESWEWIISKPRWIAGADYICTHLFSATATSMTSANAVNWPISRCL